MNLFISEAFYSVQGEGARIGKPSIFVRMAGCNLNCSWCDSKYASHSQQKYEITQEQLREVIGQYPCRHIVWTGGEPLLQSKAIGEFIRKLKKEELLPPFYHEVETNGTLPPFPLNILCQHFNVSIKLANSGNPEHERIVEDVIRSYVGTYVNAYYKFVINSKEDVDEVIYLQNKFAIPDEGIILMPQTLIHDTKKSEMIIDICKVRGWRFSPRLQIDVYGPRRGV